MTVHLLLPARDGRDEQSYRRLLAAMNPHLDIEYRTRPANKDTPVAEEGDVTPPLPW